MRHRRRTPNDNPGAWLSPLERELLDGLAEIIALNILRERGRDDDTPELQTREKEAVQC